FIFFFFSSRRRHTRCLSDWSSDVCSSDLHGQTRELLTQFGTIDIMGFDFSYADRDWGWSRGKGKDDWQSERLMAMVRELQPHIIDRKSTRLNSSHLGISYAVFCLKKKKKN